MLRVSSVAEAIISMFFGGRVRVGSHSCTASMGLPVLHLDNESGPYKAAGHEEFKQRHLIPPLSYLFWSELTAQPAKSPSSAPGAFRLL